MTQMTVSVIKVDRYWAVKWLQTKNYRLIEVYDVIEGLSAIFITDLTHHCIELKIDKE